VRIVSYYFIIMHSSKFTFENHQHKLNENKHVIICSINMPRLGFYIASLSQDLLIEFLAFEDYLYRLYRFYLDKVKKIICLSRYII
jgi:hypothetical protein